MKTKQTKKAKKDRTYVKGLSGVNSSVSHLPGADIHTPRCNATGRHFRILAALCSRLGDNCSRCLALAKSEEVY